MGTKNNPGEFDCYAAMGPDEPHFILRANDEAAPGLVLQWAGHRLSDMIAGKRALTADGCAKVAEAIHCAGTMADWHTHIKPREEAERAFQNRRVAMDNMEVSRIFGPRNLPEVTSKAKAEAVRLGMTEEEATALCGTPTGLEVMYRSALRSGEAPQTEDPTPVPPAPRSRART